MNLLSHYCRHFTGAFKFKNLQGRTFFWLCLLADVFLVSVLVALSPFGLLGRALLQRLAAVRGRLSLCADQAAAAKWWLSMPMASVSA
ncbi:hypothetical protein, partial [Pseudomonas aeruginosa]|uniref:hypothetical protein n=1 Tax=Pseudomonas aeruginosa TaxID=287 RepID=UPI002DBFA2E0